MSKPERFEEDISILEEERQYKTPTTKSNNRKTSLQKPSTKISFRHPKQTEHKTKKAKCQKAILDIHN